MKKFSFYLFLMLVVFTPVLQSCDDDDGYSVTNFIVTMGTVERSGDEGVPYFVLDPLVPVNVAATYVPFKNLTTGQRILGDFTLLSDRNDFFSHDVRLNNYWLVLTKGIIDLTEATQDSIGNSKAYITQMWVDNDYLNIMFRMRYPVSQKHMVNLVRNTTVESENDGYVHLEYRYNDMGDELEGYDGRTLLSIVSFKLNLFDANADNMEPKGIKVKINSIKNGDRVLTFNHPYEINSEAIRSQKISETVATEEIK